jgi:hypothetical protein
MKIYILIILLLCGSSCEAGQPQWGERDFIVDRLRNWTSEALVQSCTAQNQDRVFLFQKRNEYFLVTRYHGVYDIAFINAKSSPISIEASGGLGRYVEIQKQFNLLRGFSVSKVRQEDFVNHLSTAPMARCNF